MPAFEIRLVDWPLAEGGTATVTGTATIDAATAGIVSAQIDHERGRLDADGNVIGAEQDASATRRELEDIIEEMAQQMAAGRIAMAKRHAATVTEPTVADPVMSKQRA